MMKLLGAKELAALLGVSLRKLEQMIELGELPAHVKFGRTRKWQSEHVQRWLDEAFANAQADVTNRQITSCEEKIS